MLFVLVGCVVLVVVGSGVLLFGGWFEWCFGYVVMIGVILWLLCDSVVLRCCIGVGMLWFFVFNLVWVGLVICLVVLLYSMGVVVIGVYSFVGVFGFGVMCVVGKFIDCFGDWVVIGWGFVVVVFFMLLFGVVFGYLGWLGVGLVWFDVGCFVV